MILRRLMQHVKDQNWFAVGLDFMIVVSGVFVGIQVSNWNAAAADARLGRVFADRLTADLEEEAVKHGRLISYFDAVGDSAVRAVALLNSESPDPTALVVNVYRATEYAYDPPTRSTWDEIVSSGQVSLLPRRAVESGIAGYFAFDVSIDVKRAVESSPLRRRVRSALAHEVQSAIREHCGDVLDDRGIVMQFRDSCDLDLDDATLAEAARTLQADPQVLADLRFHFSVLDSARSNLRGEAVLLERSIAALKRAGAGE